MNRQRKLTWIEKKQIEKVAFDHPFFEMHGKVLSKKEAEAIIRSAEARKSGVEIVAEACDKAGVPRPDFIDKHSSAFDNLQEIIAIPAIRRIGIIAIAVILLIVFFTVTPIGRAIAENVIQYIVTLFDDGSIAINQTNNGTPLHQIDNEDFAGNDEQDISDDTETYIFLNSFDDFTKKTGKTAVVLPLPCTELYYIFESDIDYLEVRSTYKTEEGQIVTYQIWDTEGLYSSSLTGFLAYDIDESIYYSSEEKGTISIKKIYDDSILVILSKGNYSMDDLIRMLKD